MKTGPTAKIQDYVDEHARGATVGIGQEHTYYFVFVRKGKGEGELDIENPTYIVDFDRSGGGKLGLKLDVNLSTRSLFIKEVVGGLSATWNQTCGDPSVLIRSGDRIVRINAVEGDATAMMEEAKKTVPMQLEITRQTAMPVLPGLQLTLRQPFSHLEVGQEGTVTRVDEEGEALIKLKGIGNQWVCKQDFDKFIFEDSERYYFKRFSDFRNLYTALKKKLDEDPDNARIKNLPELPKEERFGFRRQMSSLGMSSFMKARREGLQKYIDVVMSQLHKLEDDAILSDFFGDDAVPDVDERVKEALWTKLDLLVEKHGPTNSAELD